MQALETGLFGGQAQYDRFRKLLNRIIENTKDDIQHIFGMDPSEIGLHSIWKGTASELIGNEAQM